MVLQRRSYLIEPHTTVPLVDRLLNPRLVAQNNDDVEENWLTPLLRHDAVVFDTLIAMID